MSDKKLSIVLFTYTPTLKHPRAKYAESTLRSALNKITYSGQISVHIADDGSPQKHRDNLFAIAGGYEKVKGVSVTNSERGGYGRSYNLATQVIHEHASVVLPLEDDWVLSRPVKIDSLVDALDNEHVSCIRLGYIGFTQLLRGIIITSGAHTFLELDPLSPERHVFAGHPRLETVDYQRRVGPWPEGLDAGATEFEVAGRHSARMGVAWPLDLDNVFHHIGSVQAREDQQ